MCRQESQTLLRKRRIRFVEHLGDGVNIVCRRDIAVQDFATRPIGNAQTLVKVELRHYRLLSRP